MVEEGLKKEHSWTPTSIVQALEDVMHLPLYCMIWGETKIQSVERNTKAAKSGVTEHPKTS